MARSSKRKKAPAPAGSVASDGAYPSWLPWLGLAVVIIFIVSVRIHLLDIPLERDEGEYAYAGQLIRQGIPPYQLAYNMKLPGVYAAYALIMTLFGETIAGIHLGLLLVNVSCIVLVFFLGKRLLGPGPAVAASLSYALLSSSRNVLGMQAHATHFVVLFALPGVLLLWKGMRQDRSWLLFLAGVCFGMGVLMKQQAAAFPLFGGLYLVWDMLWNRPRLWGKFLSRGSLLVAGTFLPYGLTCLILWRAGVFQEFWYWTVSYARAYVGEISLGEGLRIFYGATRGQWRGNGLLWLLAATGLAAVIWERRRPQMEFLIGFLAFSLLAICPGFYFREHYYVLLLPALSLLVGASMRGLPGKIPAAVPPLLLAASALWCLNSQSIYFFAATVDDASEVTYGAQPFIESPAVASWIRENSPPDSKIAVLGSEPQLYFYSHRHSATGYIYAYPLVENQPLALEMQKAMMKEIETSKPELLISVNMLASWMQAEGSPTGIFQWMKTYAAKYYVPAKVFPLRSSREDSIVIFRRKPGASAAPAG